MKKARILLMLLMFASFSGTAQNWQQVGDTVYHYWNYSEYMQVLTDTAGEIYAYHDSVLQKYQNGSWVTLSSILPGGATINIDNGTPYVVYSRYGDQPKVQKFNGAGWVSIGSVNDSSFFLSQGLLLDSNDIPYMAYTSKSPNNPLVVKKFDSFSWVDVAAVPLGDSAFLNSFEKDKSGKIYVSYYQFVNGQRKLQVRFLDGNNWASIPLTDFPDTIAVTAEVILDNNDNLYLNGSYLDSFYVFKFDGSRWNRFAPLSDHHFDYGQLLFDKTNVLYFAGGRWESQGEILRYNGIDWEFILTIAHRDTASVSLIVDKYNNIYAGLAYSWRNQPNFGIVKTISSITGLYSQGLPPTLELGLHPNPATNSIHYNVTGLQGKANYALVDITGREIMSGKIEKGITSGTLDLTGLPTGDYVFKLNSSAGTVARRVVLQ